MLLLLSPWTKNMKPWRKSARVHSLPNHKQCTRSRVVWAWKENLMLWGHCYTLKREKRRLGGCPEPWGLGFLTQQTAPNLSEALWHPEVAGVPCTTEATKYLKRSAKTTSRASLLNNQNQPSPCPCQSRLNNTETSVTRRACRAFIFEYMIENIPNCRWVEDTMNLENIIILEIIISFSLGKALDNSIYFSM